MEDQIVILTEAQTNMLKVYAAHVGAALQGAGIVSAFDAVLRIDWIDVHLPDIPMTLRIPVTDATTANVFLTGKAVASKQHGKIRDLLGILPPQLDTAEGKA